MTSECVTIDLADRSYDIRIGPGLLAEAGERIRSVTAARLAAIVTDANVAGLYLEPLRASLAAQGFGTVELTVPAGESSKSFRQLQTLLDDLLESRLERRDCIIALGGGVVGDLAGFAAAILRRGVDIIQLPTTLLAQVDSSVGGKTGINTAHGKNLAGAFHQPRLVLADTDTLRTLPAREFRAGYAELAKSALIDDADFFAWLETHRDAVFAGGPELASAIARACAAKARIVAADEREAGRRALLNLGHTFAHALEAHCRYDAERLIHGEAVAIGVVLAHEFSAAEGLLPAADVDRLRAHFRSCGLPTDIADIPGNPPSAAGLVALMGQDKKVEAGKLTFILSRGIGHAYIEKNVPSEEIVNFLSAQIADTTA